LIIYGGSAATGPIIGSLAIGHFGPWGMPVLFAIVGVLVASFAIYRAGFGRRITIEEQGQFVAVPRTTPMALEMSPITDDIVEEEDGSASHAADRPDDIGHPATDDTPDQAGSAPDQDPNQGPDQNRHNP
jgi:hypothetical protein